MTDWESSTQDTKWPVTITIIMASDSSPVTVLTQSMQSQCEYPSGTQRGMSTEFRFTCHRTSPQSPPQCLSRVLKGYTVSKLEMNALVGPDQPASPMVNCWMCGKPRETRVYSLKRKAERAARKEGNAHAQTREPPRRLRPGRGAARGKRGAIACGSWCRRSPEKGLSS